MPVIVQSRARRATSMQTCRGFGIARIAWASARPLVSTTRDARRRRLGPPAAIVQLVERASTPM